MTRALRIVRLARKDLNRIYRMLQRRSPRGAISWYRAFWAATARILEDGESFAKADEAERLKMEIRFALFKTRKGRMYRIIFEFDDVEVRVLRIRQPGQRPLRRRDVRLD